VTRALGALLLLVLPAPARAADVSIAETTTSQVVSAHGGRLAWSDGDRLMTWENGIASQVPVDEQAGGFDVNLGRGPGGTTVAVYSRAAGLYLFDFATGREVKLVKLSRAGVREQGPVVDGRQIAFFRGTATRRGLIVGNIGTGRIRAIPRMPREIGPYDLQGRRLAYTQGVFAGDRFTDTLWVHDVVTGRRRALARVSSGLMSSARFAGTTFGGRFLYAARVRRLAEGNRFMRIDVRSGRTKQVLGRKNVLEAAFSGGRAFFLVAGGETGDECAPCRLALTPPLGF
jgi:hypothetical protein